MFKFKNPFVKKIAEPVEEIWHELYLNAAQANDLILLGLTGDGMYEFLRRNFQYDDWREIRKQQGYYNIIVGFKFKFEEDAMAFKLRWE